MELFKFVRGIYDNEVMNGIVEQNDRSVTRGPVELLKQRPNTDFRKSDMPIEWLTY